jgi:hypothetical protein
MPVSHRRTSKSVTTLYINAALPRCTDATCGLILKAGKERL